MKFFFASMLSICLYLLSNFAFAGFNAHRITPENGHIRIDGKLDDKAWQSVEIFEKFYQTQPFDKTPAHVKTEVRILYDDQFLYVGLKGFDPDAQQIRESFARRDKISSDQDFFGLFIDPSGSHKAAQVFYVNANGAVMDGMMSSSGGEDMAPDYEFNVATARFDGGWSAEFRIPFSSIAYDKHSNTPWSLLVMRNMTRDQRYRMYSGEVTRATNCNLCYSDTINGMADLPSGVNWNVTPQIVSRRAVDEVMGRPIKTAHSSELSVDFKIRPDSSTSIDATLNPDFSQIELDSPQLSGNTRFSIYVQEKRPFFLEGADIFKTPFSVISTRSIANPDIGLRYTRRDAEKDFSMISTRDKEGGLVLLPHTYFTAYANATMPSVATVARANFRVGSLMIGGIATDRSYMGINAYNRVAGSDLIWQVDINQMVRAQVLLSATTAHADEHNSIAHGKLSTGHAAYFDWFKANDEWAISANVRDISKDFRADNGFFSQVGYQAMSSEFTKKFGKRGFLNELNTYISTEYKLDSEGNVLSKNMTSGIRVSGALDSNAYLSISPYIKSRVDQNGELYSLMRVSTGAGFSPSREIARVGLDLSFGDMVDVSSNRLGRGGSFSISGKLRPLNRVELEPSYALNWINNSAETHNNERAYSETAIQLNSIIHISSRDSIRMILQDSRTLRNPNLYPMEVAPESNRSVNSLVYTHAQGIGTAIYFGWTQTKSDTPNFVARRKQSELFAKLSKQI